MGVLLCGFGLLIYYTLPMALVTLDYGILFLISFILIIGACVWYFLFVCASNKTRKLKIKQTVMLFGGLIVSMNLQSSVQKIVCEIILMWEKSQIRSLVWKNLVCAIYPQTTSMQYILLFVFVLDCTLTTK